MGIVVTRYKLIVTLFWGYYTARDLENQSSK